MNLPEVLVANGTGAALVIFLFCLRVRTGESKLRAMQLFDWMLLATLVAQIAETICFLIDGKPFPGGRELQYLLNTLCTAVSPFLGLCWCLFVDYRIYRSMRHQKVKLRLFIPYIVCMGILLVNLCGTDIVFSVSQDNVYSRGPLNFVFYIVVALYYAQSIDISVRAKREGQTINFFPVGVFLVPCLVGTVLQLLCYGMAFCWLAVAMALVFVHIQLQNSDTFVDEMSGLFNRKYLNYYLHQAKKTGNKNLHGIMVDVNDFKLINDTYGHAAGDRAIQETGTILSSALPEGGIAMRMGGDEFVVLLSKSSDAQAAQTRQDILENVEHFNKVTDAPFRLSLSTGVARFNGANVEEFLSELDRSMYMEKKRYHG